MGFSFFYTEKTVSVVKEYDSIMIQIREQENKYRKDPIEAIINNNTIIPGISGEKVNINKSYSKMKRYGKYEESLLVISKIKPNILLEKNKDKYIITGNKNKNTVSLIFLVDKNDNLDNIVNILDEKGVKGNFFLDGYFVEANTNLIPILINEGHIVGNLSYNNDYTNSSFIWIENIIEKIGKQKYGYCYLENENKEAIKICKLNDNYTIKPNIIIKKNPYNEIKKNIVSGSLISLEVNSELEEELPIIINYIKSKGYNIETLDKHLSE